MFNLYTLKNKLILYFSIIFIIVSLCISFFYSNYTKDLLEQKIIDNTQNNLNYILSNVDQQLRQCQELSDWIYLNRNLDKILVRNYSDPKYNLEYDISAAYKVLNDRILNSSIGKYMVSVIIEGKNSVYLKLFEEADYIDIKALKATEWFQEGIATEKFLCNGIEDNLAKKKVNSTLFFPFARKVIFADTRKQIGWQVISFSPELISSSIRDFEVPQGDFLFLVDEQGRCLYSSNSKYLGQDLSDSIALSNKESVKDHYITTFLGEKVLAVTQKSAYSNFKIVHLVDYSIIEEQRTTATNIAFIIIIITITISCLLTVFLSSNLTRPLRRIKNRMDYISKGNFRLEPELEGNDEIGELGKGINQLAFNIDELISKVKSEEHAKKELEFKVLQSQINPHFVYNALNSIKVMAMMQKADGIYETVTALGDLLKETSKGAMSQITIEEELKLLDKYITIQKIRKKGLIQVIYSIDNEVVLYKIPKFTLQPIIENSIVHGFEGKKGVGILNISASIVEDNILIEIRDNGVGIPQDKISSILKDTKKGERYNNVGLINIDERIKLTYGEQYGLSFESKHMEYSIVRINIPKKL
ncbi:MAG: sensor histidine kinase [Ruminiclostridium sp.]